jgi:tRNA-dihydrouridine synthase B
MKLNSCDLGRVFLAPLSGVADSPFRRVCKRFGAGTVYTEMVSTQGLTRGSAKTADILRFEEEERPIGVQIFGSDPQRMAESAAIIESGKPDFIDINLSCPARKVVARGAGCALMREPDKVEAIARAVVRSTSLPVTAKMRLGWDAQSLNAARLARVLEASGIMAVAVHGRTWEQGFRGEASWSEVAKVKQSVSIPVILSGDIFSPEAAAAGLARTGCDAVMVARGTYGRPWVFRSILRHMAGEAYVEPAEAEKTEVVLLHLDLAIQRYGERQAVVRFRKHLLWYTKGMRGVVALRPEMSHMESRQEVVEILARLKEPCDRVIGDGR